MWWGDMLRYKSSAITPVSSVHVGVWWGFAEWCLGSILWGGCGGVVGGCGGL